MAQGILRRSNAPLFYYPYGAMNLVVQVRINLYQLLFIMSVRLAFRISKKRREGQSYLLSCPPPAPCACLCAPPSGWRGPLPVCPPGPVPVCPPGPVPVWPLGPLPVCSPGPLPVCPPGPVPVCPPGPVPPCRPASAAQFPAASPRPLPVR